MVRHEEENKLLLELKNPEDYALEVPGCGSPITILECSETKSKEAIELAAKLTARYSDAGADKREVLVEYWNEERKKSILVSPLDENDVNRLRI